MIKVATLLPALLLAGTSAAGAQLISIRTVPVSQAHQFEFFPSGTAGMGGVSITIADPWLDPFTNPAKGARVAGTRFFGTPSTYSVTSGAGGGRSLPLGALTRTGSWYSGFWLTLQEVDLSERPDFFGPLPVCAACNGSQIQLPPLERSKGNTYAYGMLGRELGDGLSLGGSVLWSRLNAIDGVDLLYAGSARIQQFGHAFDLRLGLLKEWSGERSLEAIVLHNRFGTTHDVYYLDGFWDPGTEQFSLLPRLEKNLDRTRVAGLHVAYEQPLSADGWRAGALLTVNRMDHPKIPNYEIMNIPRDPGNSSAFNIGLGLSKTAGRSTFGFDLIHEPIWSHTWADAEEPVEAIGGRIIPAGGMTIENRFRFSNTHARFGLEQRFALGTGGPDAGLQLGLVVREIRYGLDQHDHVLNTDRRLDESWVEWKPTWGFGVRFPELELRYHGSVIHGTGRPGVARFRGGLVDEALSVGSNILAAPSGPLTLDEVRVTTHQFTISLPVH